jgi:hypothetical protein
MIQMHSSPDLPAQAWLPECRSITLPMERLEQSLSQGPVGHSFRVDSPKMRIHFMWGLAARVRKYIALI